MNISAAHDATMHTSLIQQDVPLADKNWFRTGGHARYYCEPTSAAEFGAALDYAREHALEIFVLGEGANILISDDGFDGLVIRPQIKDLSINPGTNNAIQVTAGAGVTIRDLITYCLDNNIIGLEEFSGIPGTVGGSVFINLHYFEFLLSQFLVSGTVINKNTGEISTVDTAWFNFGYDQSNLIDSEYYLLDATFKLTTVDTIEAAYARGRRIEIARHRERRYPAKNTCGSFFRNFHADEVTFESNGRLMIYVAYYLDKLGIKGALSVGGATVSWQHANMVVTSDGATSTDLITLIRMIQQKTLDEYGIIPQPECQLIGFNEYPLLK